ncbi:hypothetical protein WJX72_008456 [[Myrmecia] bisecta]|uniref:GIY-YIG nuclease family protein n=1 Tax=[Myrmecia] bisecta TaxID=41462 RepID=A0AAW1PTK7_9CHLO
MSSVRVKTHAYLYLIREREFLLARCNVFKLGRTMQAANMRIRRFNAYKKGSEVWLVLRVPFDFVVALEAQAKSSFRAAFEQHSDGYEYFVGDPHAMMRLLWNISDTAWTQQGVAAALPAMDGEPDAEDSEVEDEGQVAADPLLSSSKAYLTIVEVSDTQAALLRAKQRLSR